MPNFRGSKSLTWCFDIIKKGEIEACFDNRHFDDVLIASVFFLACCFSLGNLDLEIVKSTLVICGMFFLFPVCQNFTCFQNSDSVQVN